MGEGIARDRPPAEAEHGVRDSDKPAGVVSRGVAAMVDIAGVLLILVICYFSVVAARLLTSVRSLPSPAGHHIHRRGIHRRVGAVSGGMLGGVRSHTRIRADGFAGGRPQRQEARR